MIVGIYYASGEAVVAPIENLPVYTGLDEKLIRKALNGHAMIPGKIVCKAPPGTPLRIPERKGKKRFV